MTNYKTHSFYKYVLSAYYVPVTVPRSGNVVMSKRDKNSCPIETYIPEGNTDNNF